MKSIKMFSYKKILKNGCKISFDLPNFGVITKDGKYLGETFYISKLTSMDLLLNQKFNTDIYEFKEEKDFYEHFYKGTNALQQTAYIKLMKEGEGIIFSKN